MGGEPVRTVMSERRPEYNAYPAAVRRTTSRLVATHSPAQSAMIGLTARRAAVIQLTSSQPVRHRVFLFVLSYKVSGGAMETTCFSTRLVDFQLFTWITSKYISLLHIARCFLGDTIQIDHRGGGLCHRDTCKTKKEKTNVSMSQTCIQIQIDTIAE